MAFLLIVLSPTRLLARWLIDRDMIVGLRTMIGWNAVFYLSLFAAFVVFSVSDIASVSTWTLYAICWLCLGRINELVFAFFGDALPKATNAHKGLPIDRRARIILLTLAYLEVVGWFGVLYATAQKLYPGEKPFHCDLTSIADAVFLSGVTLTTLGSGDLFPVKTFTRFLTLYEALIGIVFIAIGLAAYIGTSGTSGTSDGHQCTRSAS